MDFELIIQNLLTEGVKCFNSGDYDSMNHILHSNVQLIGEEIKTDKMHMQAVNVTGREKVYEYWAEVSAKYANQITNMEYITIGKTSKFVSTYGHLGIQLTTEVQLDKYGKVIKIVHFFED